MKLISNDTIHVMYQTDNNYAPYMGVSITSLLKNNCPDNNIYVHILDGGIDEHNKELIVETCLLYDAEYEFIDCEKIEKSIKKYRLHKYRGSYATFYKLFVLDSLSEEVKRIIYIDCDTVICGNIKDLFCSDMNNCSLAMCEDLLAYQYKRVLGFERNEAYYNAGVILFDVEKWRKSEEVKRIEEFVNGDSANKIRKHEQDIINLVFRNMINSLPQRYNAQSIMAMTDIRNVKRVYGSKINFSMQELQKEFDEAIILHFLEVGGEQPWVKNNIHPYNNQYHVYKENSKWNDISDITPHYSLLIRIERVLKKLLPDIIFLYLFMMAHDMKGEI